MTDQRASSGTSSSASNSAVVLSQVHVSCFITAANRATPVFEVLPERKCVRIVSKPPDDRQSTSPGSAGASGTSVYATPGTTVVPTAEWDFHTLFPSSASSHGSDFYREITLPAFRTVCEGVNTNIITLGVHPTQKFRLLFGKSTGNIELTTALASPSHSFDEKEILELYGQLGGLLNEFFTRVHQSQGTGISRAVGGSSSSNAFRPSPWRLGISSWIVVNNQVVDLLKPASAASSTASTSGAPSTSSATPLSFASLEAKTFASACKIVQIAKTNRIVLKQNAEHAHFFLRLAFFHDGQVSTLHLADLIDLKDFKDATSSAEKHELFEILTELRQPPSIPARSPMTPSKQPSASGFKARKMVLSSFLVPLLTVNAKSFLYANIIDSRSSLRECVTLLNAVANVKGYACACKRLQGVNFIQLGFQSPPFEISEKEAEDKESKQNEEVRDAAAKALAAVSIGESLLSRLGSSSPLSSSFGSLTSTRMPTYQGFQAQIDSNIVVSDKRKLFEAPSPPPPASESMSWLQAFNQRKNDILGGTVDSIAAPASLTHQSTQDADTVNSIPSAPQQTADEYPAPTSSLSLMQQQPPECSADFGVRLDSPSPPSAQIYPVSAAAASPQTNATFSKAFEAASEPQRTSPQQKPPRDEKSAALEMYERLKDSMAHQRAEKTPVRRSSSLPLPLSDESHSGSDLNSQGDLFSICRSPVSPQIGLLETPASFSYAPSPLPPPAPSPHLMSSPSLRSGSTFPGSTRNPAPALSPFPSPSPLLSVMAFEGMEDTFERANVPSRVLAPPDLDGLDAATASKVHAIDAALLRRNYDALLTIVHEQQQLREAAEAQAAEALHDQEELRATYEIQIENMKLSNVSLRSKLRALEQQTSVAKVFDQYEQELQSLTKELQQLRSRNVALELQLSRTVDGTASGLTPAIDLKKKYQQVVDEKNRLESQLTEFRKKERHFIVHSKLVGDSTRRVDQLARQLSEKEGALVDARLTKLRLDAERNQAQEEAEHFQHENAALLMEKAVTTEEMLKTKMYLASLESEQKKADVLDRFVKKHGDRMKRVQQHPDTASESWRRDASARDCEEKLFRAIKRALPQALPLANQLFRRLEMQELSLREFSEREVDFINLLVELVSDQPAVSLKSMIHSELQKLQGY